MTAHHLFVARGGEHVFEATSCDLDRHVARGALDNGRRLASEHPFER